MLLRACPDMTLDIEHDVKPITMNFELLYWRYKEKILVRIIAKLNNFFRLELLRYAISNIS